MLDPLVPGQATLLTVKVGAQDAGIGHDRVRMLASCGGSQQGARGELPEQIVGPGCPGVGPEQGGRENEKEARQRQGSCRAEMGQERGSRAGGRCGAEAGEGVGLLWAGGGAGSGRDRAAGRFIMPAGGRQHAAVPLSCTGRVRGPRLPPTLPRDAADGAARGR